jgi:hypothetical protein
VVIGAFMVLPLTNAAAGPSTGNPCEVNTHDGTRSDLRWLR